MIDYIFSMSPLSWWIIIIFSVVYFLLPYAKEFEFNRATSIDDKNLKDIGKDSQIKFSNNEYYSLCLELLTSWQWQVKMKLNISFNTYGYTQINSYILQQFDKEQQHWLNKLLVDDLSFDEKKFIELQIKCEHYQILKNTIKKDIDDD